MSSLAGQTFAGYEIISQLGRGGMGSVFKARQPKLDRLAALKIMSSELASDPDFVARFRREAAAAANLSHPNIVQVYTAGESEGTHYIAMEFVDGETLKQHIENRGRLDPREAIAITVFVAEALQYGWNKARLVHRDIKPDNIFLSKTGEVKVGDLGLAKTVGGATTNLTQTGMMMGSPHYISPEQARGAGDIDFHTDIYSLGCTLYHMLTGRPPYEGPDPLSVITKHVNDPPPAIFKSWPACPVPLALVLGKMLAKRPHERPASYEDLIEQLREVHDKLKPVTAPAPVSAIEPTQVLPTPAPSPAQPTPKPVVAKATTPRPAPVAKPKGGSRAMLYATAAVAAATTIASAIWWFAGRASTTAAARQPRQTLDLLALADPVKDRIKVERGASHSKANAWERRGTALAYVNDGGSGKLAPPVAINARTYEIEVDFERLSGPGRFHVDLPLGGNRIIPLNFDSKNKMINCRDGNPWPANRGPRAHVVVRLDRSPDDTQDRIQIRLDGELVVDWHGDAATVSQAGEPHPDFLGQPITSIYIHKDSYEVRVWQLRIFDGEAKVLRGGDTQPVAERASVRTDAADRTLARSATDNAAWQDAINLLPLIDPAQDATSGKWKAAPDGLKATDIKNMSQKIQPPYRPPEEYDYRVSFTPISGNADVAIGLTAKGRSFVFYMKKFRDDHCLGFEAISGKAIASGPTAHRFPHLEMGSRYTVVVEVRKNGLRGYLDGKLVAEWATDYSDMTAWPVWKFKNDTLPGFGCSLSTVVFHEVKLREVTDKGEFTRPAP